MSIYKLKTYDDPELDRQIEEICHNINDLGKIQQSNVTINQAGTKHVNNILIPYYVGDEWLNLTTISSIISVKQNFPTVDITVILNPEYGYLVTVAGANHVTAIKNLQSAGVRVLGYVTTLYGGTLFGYYPNTTTNDSYNITDILNVTRQKVDAWYQFYPSIDGIFFDEMDNGWSTGWVNPLTNHIAFYSDLSSYARTKGAGCIVYNPGTDVHVSFFTDIDSDCIVIIEDQWFPANSYLDGTANNSGHQFITRQKKGLIVYNQAVYSAQDFQRCSEFAGWVYVTHNNNDTGELWAWLTNYLPNQANDLASVFSSAGVIMTTPDGSKRYLIYIDNLGAVTSTLIP